MESLAAGQGTESCQLLPGQSGGVKYAPTAHCQPLCTARAGADLHKGMHTFENSIHTFIAGFVFLHRARRAHLQNYTTAKPEHKPTRPI